MEGKELFEQLNDLFDKDDLIDELGLVVSANPQDHHEARKVYLPSMTLNRNKKSPFLLFDHKLGIAYWCIPKLYAHALDLFRETRKRVYINGERESHLILQLKNSIRAILLINSDCYSALNVKKQMILDNLMTRDEEIKLLNLVFSKHPKSGEAWAHRRWVLASAGYFINSESSLSDTAQAFLRAHARDEVRVCTRMAEIYPKNYYAWTHRAWVLDHADNDVIAEELEAMDLWTKRNISDYCGFHHKQTVLLKLTERNIHQNISKPNLQLQIFP